jgi:hypothetical protein
MLLFRSEEHVTRWTESRGATTGAILTPRQGWLLAKAWFTDRLSTGWRRKTPDEAQAVFDSIGLTGAFWDVT